jgi:hypothetical protein
MTHKPEKPKGLTLPAVHTGEAVQKQVTEIPKEFETISAAETSLSRHACDDNIRASAVEDEIQDMVTGPYVERMLRFGGGKRPFRYVTKDWTTLNFKDLALEDRTSSDVIIVYSEEKRDMKDLFVQDLSDFYGERVYHLLETAKANMSNKHPAGDIMVYLLTNQDLAKKIMEEGKHYLITGMLVKYGSYFMPYLYLKDKKVVCTLINLKNLLTTEDRTLFTI